MKFKCKVCEKEVDVVNVTCGECSEKEKPHKKLLFVSREILSLQEEKRLNESIEKFLKSDKKALVISGVKFETYEFDDFAN